MPRTDKYPFRSDLRARLIDVASRRDTVNYLDLGVGRAMIGRYLYRIAAEEAAKTKRFTLASTAALRTMTVPCTFA